MASTARHSAAPVFRAKRGKSRIRTTPIEQPGFAGWNEPELAWFERLLDEEDVDIMGWALGTLAIPPEYAGAQMEAFRKLDFVEIPR